MSQKPISKTGQRSWLDWGGVAIWLFGVIFILQNAVASGQELEPRAAIIFWVTLAVWVLAGLVLWFVRSRR